MIYLGSLFLCLFLAFYYDVLGKVKNKQHWYIFLLFWFVVVSGFQYMVGVDVVRYYEAYNRDFDVLRFDISDMEGRLQPGWILFSFCCRKISHNFVFFKLMHALFVNVAVFSFFKRETKYVFTCIFLYALTSYLIMNFNILRQSMAIGCVLYSISLYKRDNYIWAMLLVLGGFMFHNSAFIALLYPVFKHIKFNKQTISLISLICILGVLFFVRVGADNLISYVLDTGMLGENITALAIHHLESDKFAVRDMQVGITRTFQIFMVSFVVLYYLLKKKDFFFGGIGVIYLFLIIVNYTIPIMFRFRLYFDMVFYIVFATVVVEYPLKSFYKLRRLSFIVFLSLFSYFPFREYSNKYEGTKYRYIDQYYPYHSILNPVYDNRKFLFFGL